MNNPRGAGRKPMLSQEQFSIMKKRINAGETITSLAKEYGISRQAIYQRMQEEKKTHEIEIKCMDNGRLLSLICVDMRKQTVRVRNYTDMLSQTPFGWNENPEWDDYEHFLGEKYLEKRMPGAVPSQYSNLLLQDTCISNISISELHDDKTLRIHPNDNSLTFSFRRKDILYTRSDTDGFQMKALSQNRKWFVKTQAVMAGKKMNDWIVEVIASELCSQLEIPHVEQIPCRVFYEGKPYMGVCSRNFELDGFSFISFERLLERNGKSSRDREFIQLNPSEKLKWCARELSDAGGIPRQQALKYMLDLALIDCLVGNTDRHTRNFGLFFSVQQGCYICPLIFDNGMGLFEHDYYRDEYTSFEDAMRTVYVEPYGEDPFDLLQILIKDFNVLSLYPDLRSINYPDYPVSTFAKEYQNRIKNILAADSE